MPQAPKHSPLTDDDAALIFRHTRELLTNVIKHAKADRVKVEVAATANEIQISIQDNGVGFEAAHVPGNDKAEGHFGLFSITESMADMGGSLKINPRRGKAAGRCCGYRSRRDERRTLNFES